MHHFTKEEIAQATHVINTMMVKCALPAGRKIDARSLTLLHRGNILRDSPLPPLETIIIDVLENESHPSKLNTSLGPLIFHKVVADESKSEATYVSDLLFSPDIRVRKAALKHFQRIMKSKSTLLLPASKSSLVKNRQPLLSLNPDQWEEAALDMHSVLCDDFLLNLAAVKQCHELGWGDGVRMYLMAILRPSMESLQRIQLGVTKPKEQRSDIDKIIKKCAERSNLADACSAYYEKIGHLPLAQHLGLGEVVSGWLRRNTAESVWDDVWSWADDAPSPLRYYHACSVFLSMPDLVPAGKHVELWNNIADIVAFADTSQSRKWGQAWALRYDLAKHYVSYLESHLPGSDGEWTASFAWWLAENVSVIFGNDEQVIEFVRRASIEPALETSSFVWSLTHPLVKSSNFRYVTIFFRFIWSLSLQCQMLDVLTHTDLETISQETRDSLGMAIEQSLLLCLPLGGRVIDDHVYAMDNSVLQLARAWVEQGDKGSAHPIGALMEHYSNITNPDNIGDTLRSIFSEFEGGRLLVCQIIRNLAYSGVAPLNDIWDCLMDEEWRYEASHKLDLRAMESLVDAIDEIASQHRDKWRLSLPHIYALFCESTTDDEQRMKVFFAFTIFSSVATGTVSGIERLLRGKSQEQIADYVEQWRSQLRKLIPITPQWAAGRIRAVLASLHISE